METKPGPKTTEFWVVIFTALLNVLNITGAWDFAPNRVSVYVMAIVSGLYAVGRGIAKVNVPYNGGSSAQPLARKSKS